MTAAADRTMDQLFDLATVLGDVMNKRLSEDGLTPARAEILWVLHRFGPSTQRALSGVLKCTPRNVTGLIDALESLGFVERTAHPSDRRAVLVRLSDRGMSLIADWTSDRAHGTTQVLDGVPIDQLSVFSSVLDHVLTQIRATYVEADDGAPR